MAIETFSEFDRSRFDEANEERHVYKAAPGLTEDIVRAISKDKDEPEWMLKKRLKALEFFKKTPIPSWGPDLSKLDMEAITYYIKPDARKNARDWDEVPEDIKNTFERLGIPEAERKVLAGAGAQYESEVVYHKLKKEWEDQGVVFLDMDEAVKQYPDMVKKHFMTKCIPITDHKFIMLHAAVWSGGTFIYVPPGVKVRMPLQAYFRMNAQKMGQFEHTLIIADRNSEIHYIEGCFTAGNLVTTNPDYRPIESIKKGDKVLTSEGEFRKVSSVHSMPYSGDLYNIELYGDSTQSIEVTGEHPFLYIDRKRKNERNKSFKPRWNMPPFFREGDYLAIPINKKVKTKKKYEFVVEKGRGCHGKNPKIVSVPASPEFFRLVGYYLAEGSVSNDSYLNFSFGSHEKEYINDVKECLNKVLGVEKVLEFEHKKNNGTSLVACSVELARVFKNFGTKAHRKKLLPWMMLEKKEYQEELVKGLFRGDGNYYRNVSEKSGHLKEILRINTVSELLARQVRDVLLRLGVVAFLNRRDRSKTGRKDMYTVGITGSHMPCFGNIVGIKIKRKLNGKERASMFGINDKFAFLPIKKIEKKIVENFPVYNFSVEEHETYAVAGAAVHNCSAPLYSTNSLHAGGVEIFVKEGARVRYSSVENWSRNTYNLNTKRALVEKDGTIEWIGGNLGSGTTMLYPCSILLGQGAKADHLAIAFAGEGQNQDTGAKVIHLAPYTSSTIVSKSISKGGGIASYRGLLKIRKGAHHVKSNVDCDALLLDDKSKTNTWPNIEINESVVDVGHEATVGKISEEQIFYLMSRGIGEEEAKKMIVSGFIEPITKALPLEYAVELNRLIELEMEGSVG